MDTRFFGFGSLVNTATHTYPNWSNEIITGWRRVWRTTSLRDPAFLSAEPAKDAELWGLSASVPNQDWHALDAREEGYDRIKIAPNLSLYSVPERNFETSTRGSILLSYLDVVIAGYFERFGEDGPTHFFDTTDGWDKDIIDDRANPLYPRAQVVSKSIIRTVDAGLAAKV